MTEQKRKDCEQCGEGLACVICGANVYEPLKLRPENTPHLKYETSERGFLSLTAIPGSYGGQVRVYESSAAEHPHIWLTTERSGEQVSVALHLTVENAKALAEQLLFLVDEHYQGDDECPGHKTVCDDDCGMNGCGCCGCDDE